MPRAPDPAAPAGAGSDGGAPDPIVCDACPVLCRISRGRSGACDRYANIDGALTRVDPLVLMRRVAAGSRAGAGAGTGAGAGANEGTGAGAVVRFAGAGRAVDDWDGTLVGADVFVTGVGAGTTYPDYKPAPFIVGAQVDGVDTVTVVTEGIFSYCSFRVKIDTDRFLGPERALVRHRGEAVGHVTTQEYGSQFLSLGGVHHLTGGSQREGRVACDLMMALGNRQPVDLQVEDGARLTVQANCAPVVNGVPERRMRVGCGSAAIGIFARQWLGHVDEVVVVDDHITGVLSEHQAGRCLAVPPSGIRLHGRRSTPGRYFRVARPGTGWGGTDITDPRSIVAGFDPRHARPGLRLLMVSTTGDDAAWYELDAALRPVPAPMPAAVRAVVERIGANCEPSLVSVLYVAGAGGSLRAGVTHDPIRLTRSIKDLLVRVTCGGAPAYVWPGGGITVMVDVAAMPLASFGWVPTPALVSPIEFTMRRDDYAALGGHLDRVVPVAQALDAARTRLAPWNPAQAWPGAPPPSRAASPAASPAAATPAASQAATPAASSPQSPPASSPATPPAPPRPGHR